MGWGVESLTDQRGCLSRRGYSIYETDMSALLREDEGQGRGLTQTPSFAPRAGTAGKPATARPDIGRPGIVDNNAAAAAALPLQLAVACIPPAALPHIELVEHTGRTS
jgi:hypothetical protein